MILCLIIHASFFNLFVTSVNFQPIMNKTKYKVMCIGCDRSDVAVLVSVLQQSLESLWLFTIYPKIQEISLRRMLMVRQFWLDRPGNFEINGKNLKGTPKFSTEISKWKMRLPFAIPHRYLGIMISQVELILASFGKLGVWGVNSKWPTYYQAFLLTI